MLTRHDYVSGFIVAFIVAALVGLLVFAVLTQFNTNTVVHDVANSQTNHSATLEHIDHLSKLDAAELAQLKKATLTVDAILSEAGLISTQLKDNMHLICLAVGAPC